MPLDLTISPVEIYHKWKQGRVLLIPFTTDYGSVAQCVFKTTWNMLYFAPLGWLLSLWPRRLFANGWRVLAAGSLDGGHRGASTTVRLDAVLRCDGHRDWLGRDLDNVVAEREPGRQRRPGGVVEAMRSRPVWLRVSIFLAWLLVLTVADWYPLNVISAASAALPPLTRMNQRHREKEWVLSADERAIRNSDGSQTLAVRTAGPFVVFADWDDGSAALAGDAMDAAG